MATSHRGQAPSHVLAPRAAGSTSTSSAPAIASLRNASTSRGSGEVNERDAERAMAWIS
jgi:hypothetical protein